ncbi:hypothetical protein GBSOP10_101052 [Armatimonadetes bacterium GBS]|jgi:hypothetical protein|nr:MAG: hypothetical protein KatS3mg021_1910 [Fimbriimonadales bacterium]CUU01617.1 hypothetical protein GBSOP10_101052 [Armatimonadetes bacterium GBS]CUU35530.1 hypothetical protein GXSOP10_12182 [Armatimonadetes bacterium GXS]
MNRQVLRLKWLVGVLAASVALLAGWLFSAESPQTPPADFQKPSQHNVLFVIPYGNAENQIYLEYTPGPGEGEFGTAIAPTGFRVLTDGCLAIIAGYPDKVVVQVFTQDGKLARAVPQPTVKTTSWTRLYLHSDGSMYYVGYWLNREELYTLPEPPSEEATEGASDGSRLKPVPNVERLFTVVNPNGAIDAALSETFRRQLYSLLEERDDIELFGTKVEVDAQGTVYLPMLLRLREGEDYERILLAKLSPRGTMELVENPPGRVVRSHDGSVVYVKFQPLEDADPRDYSWLSAYLFVRADGTEIARFRVPPRANENSLITREPVLVRPDRLAIVSFEKVAHGKPNRAESLPHFCQGYKRLMVVTPEGEIVYEDWVQGPPMTEACVTDGRGNLYYLNFTDAGVEVKKVRVP